MPVFRRPSDQRLPDAPLHPFFEREIAERRGRAAYLILSVEAARGVFAAGQGAPPDHDDGLVVEPDTIADRVVRLYRSPGANRGGTLIYFHGGGFVLGGLDSHDRNARRLALATGMVVASVDYRLAPEHRFPAAVGDAIAVTIAVLSRTDGDVVLAGDSAGATLAIIAALSVAARPCPLAGVVAFYPVTDFRAVGMSESYDRFGDGRAGLSTADMVWFRDHYAGPNDLSDWRCSPLLAPQLDRLPRTLVFVAGHDVLNAEGVAFALAAERAGVDIALEGIADANHGFLGARVLSPSTHRALGMLKAWLAEAKPQM